MINQKIFPKIFCFLILFLFISSNALAHKVTVFAWVEGNKVLGETKFSGGKRAQNAEIIVWDMEDNELLRTRTDENGEFSFTIPKKTAMRIELLAGMGHKGEWKIPIEELGADIAVPEAAVPVPKAQPAASPEAAEGRLSLDPAQLESIIEKSVEKTLNTKLSPLIKMMADLEQKEPSITDIVGGIGYIFGLMGIFLYFKSRQNNG